jgi:hypothetical protein
VVGLVAGVTSVAELADSWDRDVRPRRLLARVSVATVAIAVVGSLLGSWIVDYQPQGRYLLPTVLPVAQVLVGLRASSRWGAVSQPAVGAHVVLGWTVALLLPWRVPPLQ